ncbi:MAG: hypothetical protein IJ764_01530, partial [Bacteroidales bacterium]|nr:hypothetical protein [Bacteroidales bacterium]
DWRPVPEANVAVGASPLRASLSPNGDFLVCSANDSLQLVVPTNYLHYTLKNDVPLQGFYKDIFLDAGLYLTTRSTIPAATYLGYKLESVSCSKEADTAWQNSVIGGSADDENGRLLYPDGQPRYKILFVNGGNSRSHGQSLNPRCLQNMRTFVASGGSYVGTCAGAFFASSGYDSILDYPYYLHLWPGTMNHTGLADSSTGLFVDPGSPLLKYYTFGNDHYVANVRHNKGGYPVTWPVGTELLARYDCPALPSIHEKPAAWAYKKDDKTGRVVLEGSHPEEVTSGERRDFTAAMIKYAGDGVVVTKIKGLLRNGESRVMDGLTSGRGRINSKIGDRQYHHFAVYVPDGARKITFSVSSPVDCNMQLTICNSTYAYQDKATYKTSESGSIQSLNFENLPSGLWYVAVRLLTTVTAGDTDKGQVYSGRTDVLNGVPYTVTVSWLP